MDDDTVAGKKQRMILKLQDTVVFHTCTAAKNLAADNPTFC